MTEPSYEMGDREPGLLRAGFLDGMVAFVTGRRACMPSLDAAVRQAASLGRGGRPDGVRQAVVDFASPAGSWITGAVLDGGSSLNGF